jgi:hypothetical protein
MPFFCSPDTLIIHSKTVFLNPKYAFEMHISPEGLTKTLCNNVFVRVNPDNENHRKVLNF